MLATRISFMNELAPGLAERVARILKSPPALALTRALAIIFCTQASVTVARASKGCQSPGAYCRRTRACPVADRAVEAANDAQKRALPTRSCPLWADLTGKTAAAFARGAWPRPTPTICEAPSLTLDRRPAGARAPRWPPTTRWRSDEAARAGRPPGIRFADSMQSAGRRRRAGEIVTEWKNFAARTLPTSKPACAPRPFFDGRNMTRPACAKPGWNTTRLAAP